MRVLLDTSFALRASRSGTGIPFHPLPALARHAGRPGPLPQTVLEPDLMPIG